MIMDILWSMLVLSNRLSALVFARCNVERANVNAFAGG